MIHLATTIHPRRECKAKVLLIVSLSISLPFGDQSLERSLLSQWLDIKSGTKSKPKAAESKLSESKPREKRSPLKYLQSKLARLAQSQGKKHGLLTCDPRTQRVHAHRGRQVIEIDCLSIVKCHKWAIVRKAFDIIKRWVDVCRLSCRCGPHDRNMLAAGIKNSGEKFSRTYGKANGNGRTLSPIIEDWG